MNKFYQKGQAEALENIKANKLKLKTLGLKIRAFPEWREILLEDYKIQIDVISGCRVLDRTSDFANGYNDISKAEIKKRFGENILEDTLSKAESVSK